MSQKGPFRGSERTFFPLRGLKKGGLFIAKGAAREKQGRLFLSFHPIIPVPFCCTLSDPQSGCRCSCRCIWRQYDEVVGAVELRGGLAMRRSVHGVHEAARASRGRSGAPKVRVCTRLACGLRRLGSSLPGSEVDYSGVLRSIFPLRFQCCGDMSRVVDYPDHGGHESREPLSIFAIVCAELVIHRDLRFALEKRGAYKKTEAHASSGACLGGVVRQAARKADSQAFCSKRRPHRQAAPPPPRAGFFSQ